ncbi:hypothetical protein [Hymenobacter arizonensis]|uniref:Uncharacterized protein n=1 Tax=Hymenobacter arizonensis TaxID=1227077 RepID=A0A1I6BG72_HYMAR|nr:hypothetical protein [Hymenobacter arizonensis]SFQ79929.1 hypothetical protein SAMN04515668_4517 [Hymenobacter arizonensis]
MKTLLLRAACGFTLIMNPWAQKCAAQVPHLGLRPPSTKTQDPGGAPLSLPATSPWIVAGAQLGYKFAGNDDFADGLVASGRAQFYALDFVGQAAGLSLPLIGNISKLTTNAKNTDPDRVISELLTTSQGLNFGLYPCYEMNQGSKIATRFTLYGSGVYKLNTARATADSSLVYLNQGRFSMGLGVDVFPKEKANEMNLPLSFSVEPVVTVVKRKDYERVTGFTNKNLFSLELTGVLPIGRNTGLLAQMAVADQGPTVWRVGLLIVTGSGTGTGNQPGANGGHEKKPWETGKQGGAPATEGTQYLSAIVKGRVVNATGAVLKAQPLSIIPHVDPTDLTTYSGTAITNLSGNEVVTDANGEFTTTIIIKDEQYADKARDIYLHILNSDKAELKFKPNFVKFTVNKDGIPPKNSVADLGNISAL